MQTLQGSFTAGELAPTLSARVDFAKYQQGCKRLHNFLVQPHGGAIKRPGFALLDTLPGEARLVPFIFNADQAYCLAFGEYWLRIATSSGFIAAVDGSALHLPSPYSLQEAHNLSWVQSGDVLFLACAHKPPHKLKRLSHRDWQFEAMSFTCPVAPPQTPTVTFVNAAKMSDGSTSWAMLVTPYTYSVTAVDKEGKESVASQGVNITGPATNNWQSGDYMQISWNAVEGVAEYRIYKASFGGSAGYVAATGDTLYRDYNVAPISAETPPLWKDPFPDNDYPCVVGFFEQRLVFASTSKRPQTVFLSRSGDYDNFSSSEPVRADDAVELTIASNEVSRMYWLVALRSLILGSEGVEWELSSHEGPFSAKTARVTPQSYRGSAPLPALVVGNAVLHIARSGQELRDLRYDFGSDSYGGSDRTILARHLFEHNRIMAWAYQPSPSSIVWIIRDDGVLLGMTCQQEHDIFAWHQHHTDGRFISLASIPNKYSDNLFAIVQRGAHWTMEVMASEEQAMYLDCAMTYEGSPVASLSGLEIFEGKKVGLVGDGAMLPAQVVKNGTVPLGKLCRKVVAGLQYVADLETMPVEVVGQFGASVSRKKTLFAVNVLFANTVTAQVGTSFENMENVVFNTAENLDTPAKPAGGSKRVVMHPAVGSAATVCIRSSDPLPMTILALSPEVVVQ